MNENSQPEPAQDPQAPPRLIAAVKKAQPKRFFVPPSVDAAILKAARQHLEAGSKPRHSFFRSWRLWPALVTACLMLGGLVYLLTKTGSSIYAKEDINHDGKVDILDSFALARNIKAGHSSTTLDINGDGIVDERDVKLLAERAVKIAKNTQ